MSAKYLTRKTAFVVLYFGVIAMRMRQHWHIGGPPFNPFIVSFEAMLHAFILPGALAVVLVRHMMLLSYLGGVGVWLLVTALVWFFPLARVRRMFGTYDAVSGEGNGGSLSFSRYAAAALDTLRRLKVGKGKMGGWA